MSIDIKSESFRKQISATVDEDGWPIGEYPDYPEMDSDKAIELLDKDEFWIRSANLEYYYRYAVVENAETGERFFIRKTKTEHWFTILKWLADREDHIEIVLKK